MFSSLGSSNQPTGTQVQFSPVSGSDTMIKNGVSKDIVTKLMCITAMQQYQNKSLEELRVEDYQADRKFPTQGFGSNTMGQKTSLFGGNTTSPFSSNNVLGQKPSLFGGNTTSPFSSGNTAQKPSMSGGTSSAFGAPATGGSLFGGNTTTSQPSGSGLFGGAQQTATTGSLFGGAQAQKPSMFGGTPSAFGAQSTGGSLFGGTQKTAQPSTGIFGGAQQPAATGSLFGGPQQTATSGSLFGGNQQNTNPTGSLFGGTQQNTNLTGSLFGGPQQNTNTTGSLFGGAQAQKPSMFGGTSSTFGAQSTGGSIFGGPQPTAQPSTGIFGGAQQPAATGSLFGGPQQTATSGSLFGGNQQNTNPAGSLFGGTQQNTNPTGSLFGGAQTQKPSMFGGTSSAFGAPATGGSIFGGTQAASQPSTGIFGGAQQTSTTGSLFGGAQAQKPSMFGGSITSGVPATGSLFGGGTQAISQPSTGLFGGASAFGQQQPSTQFQMPQSTIGQQQPIMLSGDSSEAVIRQAIIESQLAMYPYGDSQILRSFSLTTNQEEAKEAVKQQMEKERQNENYFAPSRLNASKDSDNTGKRYQQSVLSAGRQSVFNYKPLVHRSGFATTELNNSSDNHHTTVDHSSSVNESFKIPKTNLFVPSLSSMSKKQDNPKHLDLSAISDVVPGNCRSARLSLSRPMDSDVHTSSPVIPPSGTEPVQDLIFDTTTSPKSNERPREVTMNGSLNESSQRQADESAHEMTIKHGPAGVTLSKRDIFTEPPFEEMENFVQDGKIRLVDGLVIKRLNYGSIEWPGVIEFSDVDLGDLVRFQRKQVVVYPDETKKPPVGEGFNRTAIISLENIYPYCRETKEEIRDPLSEEAKEFSRILERKCIKMDCDFLEYDSESGIWKFRVKHFSRYGFFEDDEEDESLIATQPKRRKPDSKPLQPIQENVEEQQIPVNGGETSEDSKKKNQRSLGFDESDTTATFIDPKSLFISNFDDGKFKRMGIAEDIMDFIDPVASNDSLLDNKALSIRKRTRTITDFPLVDSFFSDSTFHQVTRLHGSPLARRIGFGPSTNTFVTALLDPHQSSNKVLVSKVKLVPTIEAYLINFLKLKNRESDFQQLLQTKVLCMKPPSDFLRLIDLYLFESLRNNYSLDVINEKMHNFCFAICQDLNDVRFDILQRHAFVEWLREELSDELNKKLDALKLDKKSSPYAAIFYCLHYGFIEKAVEVAADKGLFQLSLSISMYINGRVSERLTQYSKKMFDSMKQVNNADKYRRRVYAILARLFNFTQSGTTVNLLPEETNIQTLAIKLNYFAPRRCGILFSFSP